MAEDAHHLDEDVDQFEDFRLVDLLVDLVFADVVGDVEEGDQFQLQLFLLEAELHLHPLQRVRLHHQLDVLLEVSLHDLHLHLLVVLRTRTLRSLLSALLVFLLGQRLLDELDPLLLLLERNVFDFSRSGRFFGEILSVDAVGPDHVSVELFAEDDIVLEAGLYFEVVLAFLVHISEHDHAIGDLLLEQRDLLLHAKPNRLVPLRVVLLLLLVVAHFNNIIRSRSNKYHPTQPIPLIPPRST